MISKDFQTLTGSISRNNIVTFYYFVLFIIDNRGGTMTDKEILKGVIEKVEKKGFDYSEWYEKNCKYFEVEWECSITSYEVLLQSKMYIVLIFSTPFVKALWGEGTRYIDCIDTERGEHLCTNMKNWQYHLQQMVLEENPLQYLERFLTNENIKRKE